MTSDVQEQFNESAAYLNRNQLGSIEIVKELKEGEKKDRNAKIANDFKVIKQTIESLIKDQTDFMVKECKNEGQFLFGRGTMNGLMLALEEFSKFRDQFLEETKGKEMFDKFKPI